MATLQEVEAALRKAYSTGEIDLAKRLAEDYSKMKSQQEPMSWPEAAKQGAGNFGSSLWNVAKDTAGALSHPIDTANVLTGAAAGGLRNIAPEWLTNANDKLNQSLGIGPSQQDIQNNQAMASAIGQGIKSNWGSEEAIKQRLANDPASMMMDLSALINLGGGAISTAGKVTNAGKVVNAGKAISKAGRTIDPLADAIKAGGYVGKNMISPVAKSAYSNIVGGIGTHTGAQSIREAGKAGFEGGQKGTDFLNNLRNNAPFSDIVDESKTALKNIRKTGSERYTSSMNALRQDSTILPFQPIRKAMSDAFNIGRYEGESLNREAAQIQSKLINLVDRWEHKDPAKFHTISGLDALKKSIGNVRKSTLPNTPSRVVADNVYNSVKNEIIKQSPKYAEVMQESAGRIKNAQNIEKTFSLGEKAMEDTAIRKLQSLPRNNVNTTFGNRLELAKQLENNGASNLMSKISGQSLNSWTPRGLGGAVATGLGGYGLGAMNPSVIPLMIMQSPRAMGELTYYLGKTGGATTKGTQGMLQMLTDIGIPPDAAPNILYQLSQMNNKKE